MGFFLLFQGSKGDLGMTGPTGAAGLPVSVMLSLHLSLPLAKALPGQEPQSLSKHPEPRRMLISMTEEAANSRAGGTALLGTAQGRPGDTWPLGGTRSSAMWTI